MVDYADLAAKFGAKGVKGKVSFAPEERPTTDYGALARQFGATGSTAAEPAPALPEEGIPSERRTWPEAIMEGVTNIPSSAYKFGAETVSMLNPANIPETARGLELAGYGALRAGAEKVLPSNAFAYLSTLENPEFAAQAQQAAETAGAHYARYFTEEGWKEAIATDPVGTMADISMLASGVAGGARGLSRAGLAGTTVAPIGEAAAKLAARTDPLRVASGAISNVGVPLMAKAAEITNRVAAPRYFELQRAMGDKGREIINAMRSPQAALVPGSQPTGGVVASVVPSTGFAGLTSSAMSVLPDEYRAAEKANIAARQKALETAAGGPKGIEKARAAREGITAPMYEAAKKIKVSEDAALQELMSRPFIKDVTRVARDIAKNKGEAFKIGETAPAKTVASTILDEFGRPVTREIPATMAEYSVRDLHNLKIAMDKIITKGPSEFAIDRMDMNALKQARAEFIRWLDTKVPEYGAARAEYAALSKPVNRAEILTYLKDTLKGITEGTQRGRAFIKAAGVDAPKTIQRAIDAAPRFNDLSEILEPKDIELVKNIARDLSREEEFTDLAKWRGEMGPKAQKIGQDALFKMPNFIADWTAIMATRVFKAFQGRLSESEAKKIALANLDPKAMAVLAGEALMSERKMKATVEKRKAVMDTAAQVMRSPEMLSAQRAYNAMIEEPKNAMAR